MTAAAYPLLRIPLDQLRPYERQARRTWSDEALRSLTDSVRAHGVIQPIIVRERPGPTPWEIVAGERRWRAAKAAGLSEIPAVVRNDLADEGIEVLHLVENIQRESLDLLDESHATKRLVDMVGREQAMNDLGRSPAWVSRRLAVLELPEPVLELVNDGLLESAEIATGLAQMFQLRSEHERTTATLQVARDGALTRSGLREQLQLLRQEIEQEEAAERARQSALPLVAENQDHEVPTQLPVEQAHEPPAAEQQAPDAASPAVSAAEQQTAEPDHAERGSTSKDEELQAPIQTAAPQPAPQPAPQAAPAPQKQAPAPASRPAPVEQPPKAPDTPPPAPAPQALRRLAEALIGAEKVSITISPDTEPGHVQCVFLPLLATAPATLSDEAQRLRAQLARPFILRGAASALDALLDDFLRGQAIARTGLREGYDSAVAAAAASKRKPIASKVKKPPPKKQTRKPRPAKPKPTSEVVATTP